MSACIQDNQKAIGEEHKKKDDELERQTLLAEQRREEERLLREEQQREKMEKIKAVEGKTDDCEWSTNGKIQVVVVYPYSCSTAASTHLLVYDTK